MAKASKLPSGNWRVLAAKSVNGKTYRKSFTADTKKAAEAEAAAWVLSHSIPKNKISLSSACEEYIKCRKNIVSPVTVATYNGYIKRYLQSLMNKNIFAISQSELQYAFNDISENHSPKTVKSIYGFFRSVFLQNNIQINIHLMNIQKPIYNVPDAALGKKILNAVKGTDIEIPINLALRCGLRISEICGLKKEKVTKDFIIIDNVKVRFGNECYEKVPKSAAGTRKVPVPKNLYSLIKKLPKEQEYVYENHPATLRKEFKKILIKNKLPNMRIHDLRHGFASSMAVLGIPERYAMAIGGWDTSTVLHGIYEQTFSDKEKEFAKQINSYFT